MTRGNRVSIASSASRFAIIFSLLFGCTGESDAQGPKANPRERRPPEQGGLRVLFIGNSLTYSNDLPLIVQALAKAAGQPMYVDSVTFGGFSLDDHWNSGEALKAIARQKWDVVVLQHGPSSLLSSRAELRASAKKYDKRIRKAGARPALYMVWPELSRFEYFDAVRESYSLAASDIDGIFLPAGEAWRAAWRRDPDAPLYSGDDFHPSVEGSYTAALSIYGMLFKRDPKGLPARLKLANGRVLEVPQELARLLQEAATEANKTYGRR
jgi:hypothetical protein